MSALTKLIPLVLFGTAAVAQACGSVKIDDVPYDQGGRQFPVSGVIRGNVVYQGPLPCSENGHIVGVAVVLLFDRRNPPPPDGLANTAVNFVTVSGDVLFKDVPREPSSTRYCPKDHGVTTVVTKTAPFAISPVDAGSYVIQAFYDYTGDFLPTFKFRNLPMLGDIGGGAIDTSDPFKTIQITAQDGSPLTITKSQDANYAPIFTPVDVGIPGAVPPDSRRGVPAFTMPPEGYIADNVTVSMGAELPFTRPYFWPAGSEAPASGPSATENDPNYVPILTMEQDKQVLAQPSQNDVTTGNGQQILDEFQQSFSVVRLNYGLPAPELPAGVDPRNPFHLQIEPAPAGGLLIWHNGTHTSYGGSPSDDAVPESGLLPRLWPLVVFAKLKDDPGHTTDPQGLVAQGSDLKQPVVIIQGITLFNDSLYQMATAAFTEPIPTEPSAKSLFDHVSVLIRPSVLCIDPRHIDRGGTLVTPHLLGNLPKNATHDANGKPQDGQPTHALVDPNALKQSGQLQNLLNAQTPFLPGCLPKGRYGINVVYPTGQAWSTPNEMGSCAPKEGATDFGQDPGTCLTQPRPVLYSQGNRAVIEIGDEKEAGFCEKNQVPSACTTLLAE